MNVLFITIENYRNFNQRSIYLDLINEFIDNGHYVTILSACESRDKESCSHEYDFGEKGRIIKVFVPNITKVSNFIAKGINLLLSIPIFDAAAKKVMKNHVFDLVLYGSPPISIYKAICSVKKKQGAVTYLMLKDIWPYDCLFGGALSQTGWKKIAFDFLAYLARKLYDTSDTIGCMSPANIKFLLDNEPNIDKEKIEVCPNSIKPFFVEMDNTKRSNIREKYGIPQDKIVFIYGGSLGVPQGIDYAVNSVLLSKIVRKAFFVFVGGGVERKKIEQFVDKEQPNNFILLPAMKKDEYETLVFACDVGLIYLNHDCLAPNFPSRLLTYMQSSIPVLCATDTYTDVGQIAVDNKFGLWCESNDLEQFVRLIELFCDDVSRIQMGKNAYRYLNDHFTVSTTYKLIVEKIPSIKKCENEK